MFYGCQPRIPHMEQMRCFVFILNTIIVFIMLSLCSGLCYRGPHLMLFIPWNWRFSWFESAHCESKYASSDSASSFCRKKLYNLYHQGNNFYTPALLIHRYRCHCKMSEFYLKLLLFLVVESHHLFLFVLRDNRFSSWGTKSSLVKIAWSIVKNKNNVPNKV